MKKIWECAYKTAGVATPADICAIYKSDQNGPYICSKAVVSSSFPTTKDDAIIYYETNYTSDSICAPLKQNAPFQCTGSAMKSIPEILSLSYSTSELIFGLFGGCIVYFLYETSKREYVIAGTMVNDSNDSRDHVMDENALIKRLDDLEADNKTMKADNISLKADNKSLKVWRAKIKSQKSKNTPRSNNPLLAPQLEIRTDPGTGKQYTHDKKTGVTAWL